MALLAAVLLVAACDIPQARATTMAAIPAHPNGAAVASVPQFPDAIRSGTGAIDAGAPSIGTAPTAARRAKADVRQVVADATAAQPAASSDAFVDTIGFNAHLENPHSRYATNFSQLRALLTGAGIRHLRVGMEFGNQNYYDQMKQLAGDGIHGIYVTSPRFDKSQLLEYPQLVAPSFEGYEAPNEPDHQSDPDWVQKYRTFQQNLYTWVKSDPRTRQYPVIGPSVTSHFSDFGDISAYIDFANIHNYLDVYNPDTTGWGGKTPYGGYGSIKYNMNITKTISGNKPVISTETGYGATPDGAMTGSNRPTLNYAAQLRYLPRLFFEQFRYGIARTYVYEFLDEGGDGTFANFGVVKTDMTPKPAYTALKSIIGELNDPGPSYRATPLAFELSGDTNNVQTVLLQKRNGQYILAIWLEVRSWNPHGGGNYAVPNQQVQFKASRAFASARLSALDENGNFSYATLSSANGEISIPVSDKISLVTLTPN